MLVFDAPGFLLLPQRQATIPCACGGIGVWLLRVIAGTRCEVRGRENLPAGGALIAAKHQSMFETFALVPLLPIPTYVMKASSAGSRCSASTRSPRE